MISQMVIYTPWAKNPTALIEITRLAKRYLSKIPGTQLHLGTAIASDRAVAISNGKVVMTTTWKSDDDRRRYFGHRRHMDYVCEVLRGWKLTGEDDGPAAADNFIEHILRGSVQCTWERNLYVPDNKVVWGGEEIVLYQWEPC